MNTKLNHIIVIIQVRSYVNNLSLSDFWFEKYQMQDNACYWTWRVSPIAHITIDSQMFYRFYNTKSFISKSPKLGIIWISDGKFRVTFCPELTMPELKYFLEVRHLKREYPGRCWNIGNKIGIIKHRHKKSNIGFGYIFNWRIKFWLKFI